MSIVGLVTIVLGIILVLLICYVLLIVVERVFGPIDTTVKSLIGIIILLCILLYLLQFFGAFGHWRVR